MSATTWWSRMNATTCFDARLEEVGKWRQGGFMPRRPRVLIEGGVYHVYSRVASGEQVFASVPA